MKRWKVYLGIVLAVAVLVVYAQWSRSGGPVRVEVARVSRGPLTASFTADGVIRGKTVNIATKVAARVEAILVREGQQVQPGSVLVRLDARDLRAGQNEAEAALRAARAGVRQAEAALALARQQVGAREAQAEAALRGAEAQLQQLRAGARPQEVAQAQQQVEQARANVTAAQGALQRARDLHARGAIARADLDEAEARHEIARAQFRAASEALDMIRAGARIEELAAAKAQVDAARAGVEAARSARGEIRLRETDAEAARARVLQAEAAVLAAAALLDGATLRAPFAGVVSRIGVEVGELVSPGLAVATLFDPADLWIAADVADEDAAKAQNSPDVTVTVPALPGQRFRGRIEELAPQAELKPDAALRTRVVRIKVRLLEGVDLLRPGLEVDVEGEGTMVPEALSVPGDALLFRDNRNVVFLVEGDVARLREVRVGYMTPAAAEILDGLKEGDLVVVGGKDTLQDGRRVRVVPSARP